MKWNAKDVIAKKERQLIDKLTIAGEFVVGAAKIKCPVDTSNLMRSITKKVDKKNLSVRIGTNVEYAKYVEFGTGEQTSKRGFKGLGNFSSSWKHGMKAQPYLRPALYESIPAIRRIMRIGI